MSYIYECRLEVPAWTRDSDASRPEQYRPRLVFTRHNCADPELLAQVAAWRGDLPGRDRWIVQFYPPDRTDLYRQDDEGKHGRLRRWPRRLDPTLSEGELRQPRDTAAAAIKHALELLTQVVPKGDLGAIEKVVAILRVPLEQTTRAYQTRFRPEKER